MPKLPPLPELSDDTREAINAVIRAAARKASPLSWTIFVILMGLGLLVMFNSKTILAFQQNHLEMKHLHTAHAECEAKVARLESRVAILEHQTRQAQN